MQFKAIISIITKKHIKQYIYKAHFKGPFFSLKKYELTEACNIQINFHVFGYSNICSFN